MSSGLCFIDRNFLFRVSVCARVLMYGFHLAEINSRACTLAYTVSACLCVCVWCLTRAVWEAWPVVLVGNPTPHSHTSPHWQTAWLPSFTQSRADAVVNEGSDWLRMWQNQTWRSTTDSRRGTKRKKKRGKRVSETSTVWLVHSPIIIAIK